MLSFSLFFMGRTEELAACVDVRRSTNQVQCCSLSLHHHQFNDAHILLDSEKPVAFIDAGETTTPKVQQPPNWAAQVGADPVRNHAVVELTTCGPVVKSSKAAGARLRS